jgi:hypothetical protein
MRAAKGDAGGLFPRQRGTEPVYTLRYPASDKGQTKQATSIHKT